MGNARGVRRDFVALEKRRFEAVKLFEKDLNNSEIGRRLKASNQTVSRWRKGFWCKLLNWSCAATMTGMPARQRTPELFKGLHFDHEVVILCVRWYLSYKLSSRDLVNMMGERSVELAHTTILR